MWRRGMEPYILERSNLQLAREQFRQGNPVDENYIRPVILESWHRSEAFGVAFDNADKTIISSKALAKRIKERQTLYDLAIPFIECLYDFTTGSGFLSILADEEGYVLKTLGDAEISQLAEENALVEGCNRSERRLGTNGIGTPLETGRPIQVFAEEHYFNLHHNWVCSGAPIFDPQGKPIGVFCLTGQRDQVSFHTLGIAFAAATAITQQLRMQQAYDAIERIHKRLGVIVETAPSGILLVNRELEITQTNSKACHLLMQPSSQLVGKKITQIFDKESLTPEELRETIDEKNVIMDYNGIPVHFSLNVHATSTDEYVVLFGKTEALHKKVNRIIGAEAYFTFDDIIGSSPALHNAVELARIAAKNASNVLLTGESGTGKELFAQAIHNASSRRDGPFVALNCGALPKSLIESELFGYEKGTFTGARREGCAGKFELANGGTIFLDEIGDMPFDVQVSLLRVLQNREVSRLGSSKVTRIDVRIIAATNKNLLVAIEHDAFRSDLYYRLNVFNIHIPPLRERPGDIRPLADYFLHKYADFAQRQLEGFTEEAYRMLEGHCWRGNIRELENAVERAVYVAQSDRIEPSCLAGQLTGGASVREAWPTAGQTPPPQCQRETEASPPSGWSAPQAAFVGRIRQKDERQLIENALQSTRGNVKQAAELLGVSRRTLYRKLDLYGIDPDRLRNV